MENNQRELHSPNDYEEIPSPRDSKIDLSLQTNNPQTMRDYQTKCEDLNRENFDLKLRIFFLEQNGSNPNDTISSTVRHRRSPSQPRYYDSQDPSILQRTGYDSDQTRQLSPRNRQRPDIQTTTNSENNELRPLRSRYERDHQDNEIPRRLPRDSGEFGEHPTTLTIDPTTQTRIRSPPSDSDMPVSTHTLQFQERERRIQDENKALKQENATLASQLRQTNDEKLKAERVVKRLKEDYDAHIANLEEEQRRKLADYESYRHEQEQTYSNVNVDEYLRRIEQLEHANKQLNDKLNRTSYQEKPQTILIPTSINSQANDDNNRRFNETIERLRAESDELRRNEKYLRKNIEDLNRLLEPLNGRLPPLPRSTFSIVDDPQQTNDPVSAIGQTSVQIRQDADNVSGLTSRIAQILRERDDYQNRLREKDGQIRQYETREAEFENRILKKSDLQIEGFQHDIEHLEKQIENRDRRIKELAEENAQLRSQPKQDEDQNEKHYIQENRNLQEQVQIADEHINDLRQKLDEEQHLYDDLRRDYEKVKVALESKNIQTMENIIQEQEKQIDDIRAQLQEVENTSQQQRVYIERERDFEKAKAEQAENDIAVYKRRFNDLQNQHDQSRTALDEQQAKYEKQIRNYQNDLAQLEQERDDLNEELQLTKFEKEEQISDNDPKLIELTKANEDLKDQISRHEVRFHDSEDENKRLKNEINTLQDDQQTVIQQFDDLRVNYAKAKNDLTAAEIEKDQINEENDKLQHELGELEVQIRLQIKQEFDDEYEKRFNDLNELKDAEIQNVQKDKETIEFELEKVNHERARFENQLHEIENELHDANETIENYGKDIDRLREDLSKEKEKTEQIERELAEKYADKLKDQDEHIQRLDDQVKSNEKQITEYERQRSSPIRSDQQAANYYDQDDERSPVKRQPSSNNQELVYQLENKLRERDDVIQSLRNSRSFNEDEPTDNELELQNQVQRLRKDLEVKDRSVQQYSEDVEAQEQQIEDLQLNIKDREHKLAQINERLEQAEQKIDTQQIEIEDLVRQNERLTTVPEDKETYLKQIKDLENELQMEKQMNTATPTQERVHYQTVIDDLKSRLRQREDAIQNLQRSLRASDEELKGTRQNQNKMAGDYNRIHYQTDQLASDVENRDQTIASLREKLAEKAQELDKLHDNNLAKEQKLNELYTKMIPDDSDGKRPQTVGERAPSNVALKVELQKKEREIDELKQQLDQARRERPDQSDLSTTSPTPKEPRTKPRRNFDHLNREELLYELDMASQHNEELNNQLKIKFPTITELHNQLVEVRNELSRQKYVNQVLWRKLNALSDIHGSHTLNELAVELANYQDELAKLKSQKIRTDQTRSTIIQAASRSSSEQNLSTFYNGLSSMNNDLPSKNIKSTIALLERSNIEWQTKLARLTEQLGRSESQSRNYHREMIKYQQLLYDAGLIESTIRHRRRSADDSVIIGLNERNKTVDDLTELDNYDELKEIIRSQRKYNQQLQTRIRLNTPDIIQSPLIEKLNEQIQNLNRVIETYETESNLLKNELKKLYKTIEHNQKISQQYEQLLKDQQISIEQSKKKFTKYDQLLKKYDIHIPIFDENKEHIIDPINEYIIDLDIDIIQGNDRKKKTSLVRKDSAISSATDTNEHLKQIREKDEQIQNLNNQLQDKNEEIKQLINEINNSKKGYEDIEHQNRNEYDRIQRDLNDELQAIQSELQATKNELQQARVQLDALRKSKPKYDQAEEDNQKLRAEIQTLENEIERTKPLLDHYKTQINILEQQTPAVHDNDTSEMIIRKSELSQLLEEMRLLRRDLERSLQKQNELQAKLDENIRQSLSPREFTFSGRGVSYPDLRLISTENLLLPNMIDEKRTRPIGASVTNLDDAEYPQYSSREIQQTIPLKSYVVGEVRTHSDLRRLVEDIKFDLKAIGPDLKDKYRSRSNSSIPDASTRSFDERLGSLDEHLTHALDLIETYWKADLPEKNNHDEHVFIDQRLVEENKRLLLAQRKYIQDVQFLKQKHKEQSNHVDQLLVHLTKANQKKADTGEYLALLLRPTLDVIQKARSNIENHLKEANTNNTPPGSAQSYHHHHHQHRRHRSNRKD